MKKGHLECQTLDLVKLNQRIEDSHQEVVLMSDKMVQQLIENIRAETPVLFRVSESVAMLDMIAAFAHLVTIHDYVRPEITGCLAIKAGRHPVCEKVLFIYHLRLRSLFIDFFRYNLTDSFPMMCMQQSRLGFK